MFKGRIKLQPWNGKRKLAFAIVLILDILFLVSAVACIFSDENKEAAILFGLCLFMFSAILYEIASPLKFRCMRVVRGRMSYSQLKEAIERDEFEEPLRLWDDDAGECGRHLLFSDSWIVLGIDGIKGDPVCIPKKEVKKVWITNGELRGAGIIPGYNKHIIRFDTDRRWFLTGYLRPEDIGKAEAILKDQFPKCIVYPLEQL